MRRLAARLAERIALEGPLSAPDYVTACLHDPLDGYYATRPAIGAQGDFITAPMISQMFGELIGAWIAEVWTRLGAPSPVRLVEVGPGDATLMGDALRVLARAPGLLDAAELWLVEPSAPLRALQQARLAAAGATWVRSLGEVPPGAPLILVANEVLDCLPAHQFVRTQAGWSERHVGLDAGGALAFGLAPTPGGFAPHARLVPDSAPGTVVEVSPLQAGFAAELASMIRDRGGAALLIDYGRDRPGPGDTLQALYRHRKVDPLAMPGEADLTMYADFPAVATAAREAGAAVSGPCGQGGFLERLGIARRAETLMRARPDLAELIARQHARLVDAGQMGVLFKAIVIHSPGIAVPGFDEAAA